MVRIESEDFDLRKIMDSGQCFRLTERSPGQYRLLAGSKVLELEALPCGAMLRCSESEYQTRWQDYFDLTTDYTAFRAAVPARDRYLTAAAEFGRGIRILKQDPWEMLVTFILSQRKSIPAIKSSVEALCALCGEPLSNGLFAFPAPEAVAACPESALAGCSFGYRTPYVRAAAELAASGTLNFPALTRLRDRKLHETLQTVPGVGPKVANCVMLFGFHRLTGFPRDVWINRVIDEHYGGKFPLRRYRGFEGVIQQYLFYYGRSLGQAK